MISLALECCECCTRARGVFRQMVYLKWSEPNLYLRYVRACNNVNILEHSTPRGANPNTFAHPLSRYCPDSAALRVAGLAVLHYLRTLRGTGVVHHYVCVKPYFDSIYAD